MKPLFRERIGSKTIKRHDPPKTTYQRIMKSKLKKNFNSCYKDYHHS